VRVLLDTHFLIWTLLDLPRLAEYPWLDRYQPWGVSPVSLLELQFLAEAGRLEVQQPELQEAIAGDARYVIDEVPLLALVRHALPQSWTRDPFDRLLAAHSLARRVPLCTLDPELARHHAMVLDEVR
jgi:PIN domain nuclease of toxin-antitoxin system